MRSTQLLAIAAQAEKIRLGRKAHSLVQRVVFSIAGAVFIVWALGFGEYAGYRALESTMPVPAAALVAASANLAVAVLFLVLAAHKRKDRLGVEAKLIRNNACREFQNSLTVGLLVKRLLGSAGMGSMSSIALAGLAAKFLRGLKLMLAVAAWGAALTAIHPAAMAQGKQPVATMSQAPPPVPATPPTTNQTPPV